MPFAGPLQFEALKVYVFVGRRFWSPSFVVVPSLWVAVPLHQGTPHFFSVVARHVEDPPRRACPNSMLGYARVTIQWTQTPPLS